MNEIAVVVVEDEHVAVSIGGGLNETTGEVGEDLASGRGEVGVDMVCAEGRRGCRRRMVVVELGNGACFSGGRRGGGGVSWSGGCGCVVRKLFVCLFCGL